MNSGHRVYPGLGHPEVNSPTSCFACITSLSGVVTVWWKKVQRELDSILLSSDVLVSTSPLQGALPTPFIEGAKLAAEASRFARGSSGNLADSPLVKGDAPRSEVPACPLQALTGSAWCAARLVHLFTCLCSEQAKCGTACALMARLGKSAAHCVHRVQVVQLAGCPSRVHRV